MDLALLAASPGLLILALVLSAAAGYLIGSISFAVLVSSRLHGSDVRTKGSGNAGMTNMLRNYGKRSAIITFAGDTAKGAAGVFCGRLLMFLLVPGVEGVFGNALYGAYIAGIATILGHAFPLFFGFKGGKGIATSLGVILCLQPLVALALLAVFLVVLAFSKMVSLGSVIGIGCFPFFTLAWCLLTRDIAPVYRTACAALIALLIIWLHRENIGRIRSGTEYKFGQKRKDAGAGEATDGTGE